MNVAYILRYIQTEQDQELMMYKSVSNILINMPTHGLDILT